ncbi:hypothetical protein OPQ81_000027 [Rhizoctonia solani]|nr:hypothetical protein OPQ81_000027 [Rhizoctonia solani]
MFDSGTSGLFIPSTNTTGDSWTNLKRLIRTLEQAGSAPSRIKDYLGEFLQLTAVYETFENMWEGYETMKQELEASFLQLSNNCADLTPLRMTGCIEGLCRDIRVELAHIQYFSLIQQNNEADNSWQLLTRYQRIQALLQGLIRNTDPSTWDAPDQGDLLGVLSPAYGGHESTQITARDSCMHPPEVRRLRNWMRGNPSGAVCWVPVTKQTGISHALCAELDSIHKLGARFFFSSEISHLNSMVPSIARQLANYSTPFRLALSNSGLQTLPESLDAQFEKLIVSPLASVREALPSHLAVVIDALDGCGSIRPILDAILAKSTNLPIKFFIFSRPESYHDTVDQLFVGEASRECVLEGWDGELEIALKPLGLSELQLTHLVQRAAVLFACASAATVANGIGDDTSWLESFAPFDNRQT